MTTRIRLVAFDLDGVIYRGSRLLPGARDAALDVLRRGLELRYVTNNSSRDRGSLSRLLESFGLPAGESRIITSGGAASSWLRERFGPGAKVLVVGEEGLIRELDAAGLQAQHVLASEFGALAPEAGQGLPAEAGRMAGETAAALVVGIDRSLSFAALAAAQAAILAGALFVATNTDPVLPVEERVLPGSGAIVAALAAATGQTPVVIGKPNPAMARIVAASAGAAPEDTVFIGDNLDTDIKMGREAGMTTVLVLTGFTRREDLRPDRPQPDHVLESLDELATLLDELLS